MISSLSSKQLGALLMASGFFCYSISDAMAKILTDSFHPVQISWFRQFGLFLGVLYLILRQGFSIFKTDRPGIQLLRGLCSAVTPLLFVTAVITLPLADAIAVTFIAPFLVFAMGALFLKESLSTTQFICMIAAFLGTLIIVAYSAEREQVFWSNVNT